VTHRSVEVPLIARVEGEGALHIKTEDEEIVDLRLEIFEPPRFFEAFLQGRHFSEVPDVTARICGICPVAYQMSSILGIEELFGVKVSDGTYELRRLLYFGEYIESHVLHIFLLAAPDFLGYPDALALAKDQPELVKMVLEMKRLGNDIMAEIGGREVHPVSARIGGFSRAPKKKDLERFIPKLEWALDKMPAVADVVASLNKPSLPRDTELVSLVNDDEYPLTHGWMASDKGKKWEFKDYEKVTREIHVEHSNTLWSVMNDTGEPYSVGPLARVNLNAKHLSPLALEVAKRAGMTLPEQDPFYSMHARAAETAIAMEECIRLIQNYKQPTPALVEVKPKAGRATWATEAPRGTLYHRYDIDADGLVQSADIVPPTAQNLQHIEKDLRDILPGILNEPDAELTRLCEMVVRNYDPCISCSTHFLRVDIERT
jgi:sulfhydrogenase subunit alpha